MQTSLARLYFENAAGRVLEHPDGYVVFQYVPGPRAFSDLKALLSHTRNLFERNNWRRLLGDQRDMAPFTEEESAWIVNDWLDDSQQDAAGLFGAVLVSPEDFALFPPAHIQQQHQAGVLTYRVFGLESEAVAWLLSREV